MQSTLFGAVRSPSILLSAISRRLLTRSATRRFSCSRSCSRRIFRRAVRRRRRYRCLFRRRRVPRRNHPRRRRPSIHRARSARIPRQPVHIPRRREHREQRHAGEQRQHQWVRTLASRFSTCRRGQILRRSCRRAFRSRNCRRGRRIPCGLLDPMVHGSFFGMLLHRWHRSRSCFWFYPGATLRWRDNGR